MQFETFDDPSAQDESAGPPAATTTAYEAEREARPAWRGMRSARAVQPARRDGRGESCLPA